MNKPFSILLIAFVILFIGWGIAIWGVSQLNKKVDILDKALIEKQERIDSLTQELEDLYRAQMKFQKD